MADEIDKIIKNSSKAELLEEMEKLLVAADKVIVVSIEDKLKGKYTSQILLLGIEHTYEALGVLDIAKEDLIKEDY